MAMGNRKVFVLGEVRTPGVLMMLETMSLVEAITRAGGFTQKGYMKGVVVLNRSGDGDTKMRLADFKRMYRKGDLRAEWGFNQPFGTGDITAGACIGAGGSAGPDWIIPSSSHDSG